MPCHANLVVNCLYSFTFDTFFIHWPLSPAASSVSCCRSCFCLFWTYLWNIQWRWSLYVHIFVVCYCVIATTSARSSVVSLNTITVLMTIRNAQWNICSLYSQRVFPLFVLHNSALLLTFHNVNYRSYYLLDDKMLYVSTHQCTSHSCCANLGTPNNTFFVVPTNHYFSIIRFAL